MAGTSATREHGGGSVTLKDVWTQRPSPPLPALRGSGVGQILFPGKPSVGFSYFTPRSPDKWTSCSEKQTRGHPAPNPLTDEGVGKSRAQSPWSPAHRPPGCSDWSHGPCYKGLSWAERGLYLGPRSWALGGLDKPCTQWAFHFFNYEMRIRRLTFFPQSSVLLWR